MKGTIIGLDIGGSKTHAVAADPTGRVLAEEFAGSANLASVGERAAVRELSAVLDRLGRDGVVAVCAGAAGVDTPDGERRLHDLLAAQLPGAEIRIVHDTALILAAAGHEHGIALISGTGSVAWGRTADGRTARAGGWGYLLGDEGSGYQVARLAVRHALALADAGAEPDRLAQQLAADCGLQHADQLLSHFYANPERRYWAGHSRLVFELAGRDDPAALRIVAQIANDLAALVRTVTERLDDPGPLVCGGGLLVNQPLLRRTLADLLPDITELRVLDRDPVHGAVFLAAGLLDVCSIR